MNNSLLGAFGNLQRYISRKSNYRQGTRQRAVVRWVAGGRGKIFITGSAVGAEGRAEGPQGASWGLGRGLEQNLHLLKEISRVY